MSVRGGRLGAPHTARHGCALPSNIHTAGFTSEKADGVGKKRNDRPLYLCVARLRRCRDSSALSSFPASACLSGVASPLLFGSVYSDTCDVLEAAPRAQA